jgi:GTP cyclohydrolase I
MAGAGARGCQPGAQARAVAVVQSQRRASLQSSLQQSGAHRLAGALGGGGWNVVTTASHVCCQNCGG